MIRKLQALKSKKGFTLVELIVVVAIIGVLAAILIPILMGYILNSRISDAVSTAGNMHKSIASWQAELETRNWKVDFTAGTNLVEFLDDGAYSELTATGPGGATDAPIGFVETMEANHPGVKGFASVWFDDAGRVVGVVYSPTVDSSIADTVAEYAGGIWAIDGSDSKRPNYDKTNKDIYGTYPKAETAVATTV